MCKNIHCFVINKNPYSWLDLVKWLFENYLAIPFFHGCRRACVHRCFITTSWKSSCILLPSKILDLWLFRSCEKYSAQQKTLYAFGHCRTAHYLKVSICGLYVNTNVSRKKVLNLKDLTVFCVLCSVSLYWNGVSESELIPQVVAPAWWAIKQCQFIPTKWTSNYVVIFFNLNGAGLA